MTLTGRRILVLEDEYHLALQIERMLDLQGAIVIGPVSALEQASYVPLACIDAAVLDVRGRDGMGYVLARQLLERGIPFVFAAGHELETEPGEWCDALWVAKPYDTDCLVAALLQALAKLEDAKTFDDELR